MAEIPAPNPNEFRNKNFFIKFTHAVAKGILPSPFSTNTAIRDALYDSKKTGLADYYLNRLGRTTELAALVASIAVPGAAPIMGMAYLGAKAVNLAHEWSLQRRLGDSLGLKDKEGKFTDDIRKETAFVRLPGAVAKVIVPTPLAINPAHFAGKEQMLRRVGILAGSAAELASMGLAFTNPALGVGSYAFYKGINLLIEHSARKKREQQADPKYVKQPPDVKKFLQKWVGSPVLK